MHSCAVTVYAVAPMHAFVNGPCCLHPRPWRTSRKQMAYAGSSRTAKRLGKASLHPDFCTENANLFPSDRSQLLHTCIKPPIVPHQSLPFESASSEPTPRQCLIRANPLIAPHQSRPSACASSEPTPRKCLIRANPLTVSHQSQGPDGASSEPRPEWRLIIANTQMAPHQSQPPR
eukprot:359702-Chlamydomonas_euryale.AAC.5